MSPTTQVQVTPALTGNAWWLVPAVLGLQGTRGLPTPLSCAPFMCRGNRSVDLGGAASGLALVALQRWEQRASTFQAEMIMWEVQKPRVFY